MRNRRPAGPSILDILQQAVRAHGTNPYQIAKAVGMSLRSAQNMLVTKDNPTLRNVEAVLAGLGIELVARRTGKPTIEPGTGRGHGRQPAKRAGKPAGKPNGKPAVKAAAKRRRKG